MKLSTTLVILLAFVYSADVHSCDHHKSIGDYVGEGVAPSETSSNSTTALAFGQLRRIRNLSIVKSGSKLSSIINWDDNDSPLRIGDYNWSSVREFKEKRGRCGTKDPTEEERRLSDVMLLEWRKSASATSAGGLRRLRKVSVPVYFHCITSGNQGSCPTRTINRQISVLNSAYAPTFSFNLVYSQSYNRPEYYNCQMDSTKETQMKNELRRGGAGDLNIYTCNTLGGVLGWAKAAGGSMIDGVVLRRGTLPGGTAAPYNLGDTATHEVRPTVMQRRVSPRRTHEISCCCTGRALARSLPHIPR
jgi:hypothetical protein